jgi:pentalenene oxygenase
MLTGFCGTRSVSSWTSAAVSRVRIANRSAYLINEAGAAGQVLVSSQFDKGGPFMETARVLVGNGVITCSNADHRRQQPVLRPAFQRDQVAAYAPVMSQCVSQAMETWREGDTIDVGEQMYRLAAQVVARTLISAPAGREAADTMGRALPVLLRGMFRHMLIPWPWVHRLPLPANRRFTRARTDLTQAVGNVIAEYRNSDIRRDDLLSQVMACPEDRGTQFDDREVHDQIMSILAAGVETSASLLAWTFHALSANPQVEQQLWAEVDNALAGRLPVFDDQPRLPLTRRVLTETLRLWPPTWMLSRVALADTVVAGFTIPAGADVIIPAYALHRDPQVFDHPEAFDPDRWLPERLTPAMRQAFTAFGGGRRKCLGEFYVMTEAVLALAAISSQWQLRTPDRKPARAVPRFLLTPEGSPMTLHRRIPAHGHHIPPSSRDER